MDQERGYVMNSLMMSRHGSGPLFNQIGDQGYVAQLDRYAIIPLELFIEMVGTDHPAYQAAVQLMHKGAADDAARMTDEIITERDRNSEN